MNKLARGHGMGRLIDQDIKHKLEPLAVFRPNLRRKLTLFFDDDELCGSTGV